MKKIYIVEDNESIRELVVYALQAQEYEVYDFESSEKFWDKIQNKESKPDLIILDIMLPKEDGISILQKVRQNDELKEIPIIMMTAKSSETDRLKGFSNGADDYIVKPFSVLELVARVKVFLKRSGIDSNNKDEQNKNILSYKDLIVDLNKRKVLVSGKNIELTFKEFELLVMFLKNNGIVLTREKLLNKIWGYDYEGETRTVDMHIKTLRKKLDENVEYIKTVRGVGYKIGD